MRSDKYLRRVDEMTARVGGATTRRDALRWIAAFIASTLTVALTGCEQRDPCPVPCGEGCCGPDEVCLDGECRAADSAISGHVGPVRFWARSIADDEAEAQFQLPESGHSLHVVIVDSTTASIVWNGVSIGGYGELTSTQVLALAELESTPLFRSLWRVPLELACHFDHLAPQIYAALLFPWQVMLKYRVTDRPQHLTNALADVSCAHLPTVQQLVDGAPRPRVALLERSLPFPYVRTFWGFDEAGAIGTAAPSPADTAGVADQPIDGRDSVRFDQRLEPSAASRASTDCPAAHERRVVHYVPGAAMCRHACGADCPTTCCTSDDVVCVVSTSGRYTGYGEVARTFVCDVHDGCVDHDDCYDSCVSRYGPCLDAKGEPTLWCDGFWNNSCHRACDVSSVAKHGVNGRWWKDGKRPPWHKDHDYRKVAFEYHLGELYVPGRCPPGACAGLELPTRASDERPPDEEPCP
jgi:hypothetical protein